MTRQLQKGCVVSRVSWNFWWLDDSCLFSCFTSVFTTYTDICSRCLRALWPKMSGSPAEIWPLWLYKSADARRDLFYRYLNVVVITLPLSSRICECLVPYFDPGSDSPDSCNVSLVPGCVLFHFILVYSRYLWLVYFSSSIIAWQLEFYSLGVFALNCCRI